MMVHGPLAAFVMAKSLAFLVARQIDKSRKWRAPNSRPHH